MNGGQALVAGGHRVATLLFKIGQEGANELHRELRDGKTVEEALSLAYPLQIHNLQEFEDGWREYLKTGG